MNPASGSCRKGAAIHLVKCDLNSWVERLYGVPHYAFTAGRGIAGYQERLQHKITAQSNVLAILVGLNNSFAKGVDLVKVWQNLSIQAFQQIPRRAKKFGPQLVE